MTTEAKQKQPSDGLLRRVGNTLEAAIEPSTPARERRTAATKVVAGGGALLGGTALGIEGTSPFIHHVVVPAYNAMGPALNLVGAVPERMWIPAAISGGLVSAAGLLCAGGDAQTSREDAEGFQVAMRIGIGLAAAAGLATAAAIGGGDIGLPHAAGTADIFEAAAALGGGVVLPAALARRDNARRAAPPKPVLAE